MLPDLPESATGSQRWLLTEEERTIAIERIKVDQIAQESNRSVWYGLKRALADHRTWLFVRIWVPHVYDLTNSGIQVFLLVCNHVAYGFNYFYPAIVQGFGFGSRTVTLLCTAPPYLLGATLSFVISWSSDRRSERSLHIAIPMCTAIIGFIISVSTLNGPARYVASFLYVSGCFAANGLVYSWAAGVLNQTPEKKAVATSMINVLAQLGNIMSPYFFRDQDEPRYVLAMILLIVFAGLSATTCVVLKWDLRRANRRIVNESATSGTIPKLFTT